MHQVHQFSEIGDASSVIARRLNGRGDVSPQQQRYSVGSDVSKWVPRPPDRAQVDRALKTILSRRSARQEEITLDEMEFEEFAAEVFAKAVDSGARMEVLKRVLLGAAGIAGFGAVFMPGKEVVVAALCDSCEP
ncbi:hypothetical protein PHJA_002386200 [Phtheirospermum japonicum]|uniref:Uncharacterized protein n=1 Tax=Phtheirospermum japonicum TaxID=374723 RepID=A0A830CVX6_9LAMI|nr:hypothetical protein PHJA_002386200 [Phtheirospermum japonicum]